MFGKKIEGPHCDKRTDQRGRRGTHSCQRWQD
jgi:hypothetical protein